MNQESTSSRAGFAFDRLSGDELLRLGLAEIHHAIAPSVSPEPEFPPTKAETPGTIYVLQAPPLMPVKIGFTRAERIDFRIQCLQTGCPYPLRVIASATGLPVQERRVHALLAQYRLTGEWFEWTPAVRELVDQIADGRLPQGGTA